LAGRNGSATVRNEDAVVTFVSSTNVGCGGCSTVVVPLKVKVSELDASIGDLRNATVTFINRATGVAIGSVAAAADGTAAVNWTLTLGTAASQTFKVGFTVGNYYLRNNVADDVSIVVSK